VPAAPLVDARHLAGLDLGHQPAGELDLGAEHRDHVVVLDHEEGGVSPPFAALAAAASSWSRRRSRASARWRSRATASSGGRPWMSDSAASNCRYSLVGTATRSANHSVISTLPASVMPYTVRWGRRPSWVVATASTRPRFSMLSTTL